MCQFWKVFSILYDGIDGIECCNYFKYFEIHGYRKRWTGFETAIT